MSFNQSMSDRSENQYRRSGRSASFSQQRTNSGSFPKVGGSGTAPSPSLSSNRSFKKSSNAQGGQSRVNVPTANSSLESSGAPAPRGVQNGAQALPQLHGVSDVPAAKPTNSSAAQRSARNVPKVPSSQSQSASMSSETMAPTTPAKDDLAPRDAFRPFPFQFGSISPGFVNGMQIPARTSSAPPNLDEQKRDLGGNYGVLRNLQEQTPVQYAGGILYGPLQSLGSQAEMQRNSPAADRWRAANFQKGLIPSPQTPLQMMHKAERKYEVGKVADEEQAKQRQLEGILNKLTPQNFEKLFEQVKAVNIDNAITLAGVISHIFDKALMEPTFCEMYANFCHHLAGELPDFSEDNEKITFKRLLLNKCQEEFERGEREQEEANKVDEEGEVKQSEKEREEKRIKARRRMLGNIRLIGELYKKRMLTERIMHECIKKLLGQYHHPDEEDIEALCILMSTIGEMIDHPKAKEHMDAYFDMMAKLSSNMKLSSRVRVMLRDAIDLRKNKWQQRNSPDADRWRAVNFQKGLIRSPQTPLQMMHKAERKYEVGKVTDEEQAKQRQLKWILNKLTPQNFEKLFEQVKAVNIDNARTLTGVISQIFDKALMEPTFCEMYANLCHHLAGELPDFSEDNEKITFKRLLLNKCQEEFERGEREQEEANKVDEEGEVKQSEKEREEKRIKAQRRTLGNIRLIGELYKKRMLTERKMHECIKKLLGQYHHPDEEDIEALCILMSTIGEMIDHPKAKERMDAYFDMMAKLSNNMKLSSRVRVMLRDAIDLRKNKWQQWRKVEGPKKIEELHRDAAQERQAQARGLAHGPGINPSPRRAPMDFGPRGADILSSPNAQMGSFRGLPTQVRGFGIQDVQLGERQSYEARTFSVPLPQRPIGDESITLGPQGSLARGMSINLSPSKRTGTRTYPKCSFGKEVF